MRYGYNRRNHNRNLGSNPSHYQTHILRSCLKQQILLQSPQVLSALLTPSRNILTLNPPLTRSCPKGSAPFLTTESSPPSLEQILSPLPIPLQSPLPQTPKPKLVPTPQPAIGSIPPNTNSSPPSCARTPSPPPLPILHHSPARSPP